MLCDDGHHILCVTKHFKVQVPLEPLSDFEGQVGGKLGIHVGTILPRPTLPRVIRYGDRGPHRNMLFIISIGVGMGAYSDGMTSRSTL